MGDINWDKVADAEYWCDGQFFKTIDGEWYVLPEGERSWRRPPYQSPDNFSWWGSAIERPLKSWSGEGLPPVETVCQCHLPDRLTNRYRWVSAKVIWHNGPTECAVIHDSCLYWCDEFRPALTQAQLDLESRRRAIEEMLSLFGGADSRDTYLMQTLYDKGYRKFEITDDSDPA